MNKYKDLFDKVDQYLKSDSSKYEGLYLTEDDYKIILKALALVSNCDSISRKGLLNNVTLSVDYGWDKVLFKTIIMDMPTIDMEDIDE